MSLSQFGFQHFTIGLKEHLCGACAEKTPCVLTGGAGATDDGEVK